MQDFNLLGIYTYEQLLCALQNGLRLRRVMDMRDGTHALQTVLSADREYIRWNNYGSSANTATADELQFVIETIFKTTLADILRRYVLD